MSACMTGIVQLREVVSDDLPILFEHQRDPDATRMAAFPARDWPAFAAHWDRILHDDTVIVRAITLEGAVAGNIGSFEQDGKRLIGYWIGKPFWGRGVATAALELFLALEITRPLFAYAATHNHGSIRVLEKCGFRIVEADHRADDGVSEVLLELDA